MKLPSVKSTGQRKVTIAIVTVCVMAVAVFLLFSARKGQEGRSDEPTSVRQKGKSNPASVSPSSGEGISKTTPTKQPADADLKFLDVMWPFLPERHQKMFNEAKARREIRNPKTFSEVAGMGEELVGYISKGGKLMEFYAELQKAAAGDPDNLNLLRTMVLVSSFRGFAEGEYEKNLSRLAQLDSNDDVLFPYAQMQLEKGEPAAAYSSIQRNVTEHPDQASSTLTSALRIFAKAKADEQKTLVVGQLKGLELTASQADRCGGYLYESGDADDAVYFYRQNANRESNPFFREAAQVKLCKVQIAKGARDEQTVETLKELALKSRTPAIKAEATKALSSINVALPRRRNNSNNTPGNNGQDH